MAKERTKSKPIDNIAALPNTKAGKALSRTPLQRRQSPPLQTAKSNQPLRQFDQHSAASAVKHREAPSVAAFQSRVNPEND
jgi:hypothetical protein